MTKLLAAAVTTMCALMACGPTDPCAGGGTATLRVSLAPQVDRSNARVVLSGPGGRTVEARAMAATETIELTGVPSGRWSAVAEPFATPRGLVREVRQGAVDPATFCVAIDGSQEVTATWQVDPTSNKLWALNGPGGSGALLSFAASDLTASGAPMALTQGPGPYGKDVTFDRHGNLWALGGTTADPMIVRTRGGGLVGDGPKTADVKLQVEGLSCLPALAALAFDRAGNLWVSSACKNQVLKLDASELETSGTVTPSVVLSGLQSPIGLAFDGSGNLWVADSDLKRVLRYDAAALAASTSAPSSSLLVRASDTMGDLTPLAPFWLAFDEGGDLWADDFGGNVIFRVAKADLAGSGERTVTPPVRVTLPVSALPEGLTFDEAGGLWVAYGQGKLARLDPAQLGASTGAGAPTAPATIISSGDIGYVSNTALWPAPAALPLAHALP